MNEFQGGLRLRVRGRVQGVGFRPWVARTARELGLRGNVCNEGDSVRIEGWGSEAGLKELLHRLRHAMPAPAEVRDIECEALGRPCEQAVFQIQDSDSLHSGLAMTPDLASCADCLQEMRDPGARRYRYPFTSCSQCGPRLSIQQSIPWDRAATTMQAFPLCPQCNSEYLDPQDRRFHAQQLACPDCGPSLSLQVPGSEAANVSGEAALQAAIELLQAGGIVAIKGTGGWQIACDASNTATLERLRTGKNRPHKPFALMARDTDVIQRYARVNEQELAALQGAAAPIVLLRARAGGLPRQLAPGLDRYGFMLPHSPLHQLLLEPFAMPLVMTSGNRAGEPQLIDDQLAVQQLADMVDAFLGHDRAIAHRVDDSVLRVDAHGPRMLRAGRGVAPLSFAAPAPAGDTCALASGAQLKNSFAIVSDGRITVSQHIGDLDTRAVRDDLQRAQELYFGLLPRTLTTIATDLHPDYASTQAAEALAARCGAQLQRVPHHHAHLAACLLEHGWSAAAPAVLGVVLDGLGMGADGQLWGGEFLLGSYQHCERLASFKPVPLLGGPVAMREPWRNTHAHLMAELGMPWLRMNFAELELCRFLEARDPSLLAAVLADSRLSPPASSCGRLFDAVAAAVGICRDSISYEGQAAMALEAAIDAEALADQSGDAAYPFAIPKLQGSGLPYIEPVAMWQALLGDLHLGTAPGVIAARFHRGLANVIIRMVHLLRAPGRDSHFDTVVLSGGVFQNRTLCELVAQSLTASGLQVLQPCRLPAGDGGIAAGQAAIVTARGV